MPGRSSIEWTHSTWNPVTGCTKVSTGCENCYALVLAHGRLRQTYLKKRPVVESDETRDDPFAVRVWRERLDQPRKWKDSRMIFVNSMSDLFHADIPADYVRDIFRVMLEEDHHIFQVLTKRPARAARFLRSAEGLLGPDGLLPRHIWIGASVEDEEATFRVDHLRSVPASMRFLSCEPLLGPLDLDLTGIDWVIVGGESGSGHRDMKEEWVVSIRDQCLTAGVPFFFKQWGGYTPKAGGRELQGRTWDEFPSMEVATR